MYPRKDPARSPPGCTGPWVNASHDVDGVDKQKPAVVQRVVLLHRGAGAITELAYRLRVFGPVTVWVERGG